MLWRKKKGVTIADTFLAVLFVLILMLGTLLAVTTNKVLSLKEEVRDLKSQISMNGKKEDKVEVVELPVEE